MKKAFLHPLLLLLFYIFCQNIWAQTIPFTSDRWDIEARGNIIDGYEGVEDALLLQSGKATLSGTSFKNGIIEFDIYLSERRSFPGVLFRMADDSNYEEFYLRPHQSGNPDAMQYLPVFNGATPWQLYHDQGDAVQDGRVTWQMVESEGYNTIYTYPFDRWLHVKLVIAGRRADVYFDHEEKPTLQVRELKREPISGGVCIRAFVSPVYFANFSIQEIEQPPISSLEPVPPESIASVISKWEISPPFNEQILEGQYSLEKEFIKQQTWQVLESEASGLCNVAKVTKRETRKDNTVFTRSIIQSADGKTKRLDFGYSDRVKVYCNGQLLYSGNNGFRTRDYRYLGTIGYFDSVYLPFKKGSNEIIFAVSESFGGWGVQAKLENMEGINLTN